MPTINKPQKSGNSERRKARQKCYRLKEWRELSKWYRMTHPLCEECQKKGITTAVNEVHHILSPFDHNISQDEKMRRLLDETNLMALCRGCHIELHQKQEKNKKK